ncbi:unnamed protein product [Caenorhabditis angaria]|uniref:NR LBD domain-containing protein n=1 Tax=Caenorhabditis angaria TaxID=860376 RepID=A0A9P1IXL9_9PELO|nr:unnamed protein product [Caenorhabditis angaria]
MEENRKRKQTKAGPLRILINSSTKFDYSIWNLSHLDVKILKLRNSTYNPLHILCFEQLLNAPSILNLAEMYKPMSGWPLTPQEYGEKQHKLNIAFMNSDRNLLDQSINTKHWMKFDIMLSIEYLKTFEFFQCLKLSDRIILAKHVTVIIQSMTFSFTSFENNSDCFRTPDGYFIDFKNTIDLCKIFTRGEEKKTVSCVRNHLKSSQNVMGFLIREKLTNTEYILLKAIAICDPIFDLSEEGRKIVCETRQNYSKTLFKYCQIVNGVRNGPSRFVKLLSYINLLIQHQKSLQKFMTIMKMYAVQKSPKTIEDSVLDQTLMCGLYKLKASIVFMRRIT